MYKSLAITLLAVASTTINANDFLGMERILQTATGTTISSACTTDSTCQPGLCCADYRRINGTVTTNVTRVCVNTQLHNRTIIFNNLNHTWVCSNQTTLTANAVTSCSSNTQCSAITNGCCQTR